MKVERISETVDYITVDAVARSATHLIQKGAVMVVVRSGILKHSLPVAIADCEVTLNQDMKAVELNDGFLPEYVAWALRASANDILHRCTKSGTTVQNLEIPTFLQYEIPVVPLADQRRIVAELETQLTRLDASVTALKRVQANLKRYRASVLKAACEGRLTHTGGSHEGSLPEGWAWTTIGQLANVVRGGSPRPAGDPRYFGGTVPWITVGPITADENPYLRSVPQTLTDAGRERSRFIDPHTLLLTNSGATLGVPKISLIGGCINDGVAALLGLEYPLKLYLLYFLRSQTQKLRGVNQGAAQPNLNTTLIKAIPVPLPPEEEQQRIVAEVERRLSVIEELEATVAANLKRAERMRQNVLSEAFQGR